MEHADALPPFIELAGTSVRQKIVDIGARHISGEPVYAPLLRGGEATVVGFEPDEAAVEELNARKNPGDVYLPYAVGDGGRHTLHICAARDMTSLLKPNRQAMELFHGFPVWSEIVATQEIDTVRLDDVPETDGATFLELDVQGAELMILQNAVERLRRAYVLHVEVEFLPLYEGQPLFSEIELFLRAQGYVLHRFTPLTSRVLRPLMLGKDIFAGMSQIVWSDAIFVRDFMRPELLADEELIGLAQIVHDCYRSADLALRLLTEHDRRSGRNLARAYIIGLRHRSAAPAAQAAAG
ncbi:FkbM family methyltransferase [Methylosinus sp. H3A]|uniref:FkbM family methyltransferase n=1 Tax=Methylosinus sp. H3A TaxID=2785786 RepID=UPI0018C3407B|nr:FkbM family methyltransferase [Methylosinus sp. H3A]MBG0810853.1 FkbM family methyltransferase [Methylosinus sp. H3A]